MTGATSYDVYFGTSSTPPFVTNVTGTSYSPAALQPGTVYYWNIVARNGGVTATSSTFSFTTQFPSMSLSETTLNFGSGGGSITDPQFVTVSFAGSARGGLDGVIESGQRARFADFGYRTRHIEDHRHRPDQARRSPSPRRAQPTRRCRSR